MYRCRNRRRDCPPALIYSMLRGRHHAVYSDHYGQCALITTMKVIKNPDTEFANSVQKEVKKNNGYCPCAIERNKDTKCMCKEFRDQVARGEPGYCHCGLWCAT